MFFYTHNIGTFSIATQYLTDQELGIYVRLRDHYLSTEKPLQCNWIAIAMRMHCKESVENVLALLFEKDGDCYRSEELDEIIHEFNKKAAKLSENAKKRWSKAKDDANAMQLDSNGNANAVQMQCESNAIGKPTNNQEPITNTTTNVVVKKNIKKKVSVEKPEGVDEQTWSDFLVLRKDKGAPVTQTAINGIIREAEKAGISLATALQTMCQRGWQGFKAEWVNKTSNPTTLSNGASVSKWGAKFIEPDWSTVDYGETGKLV